MAANFLGLFFLVIGSTGISNALSLNEFFERSKRSTYLPYHFKNEIQSFRDRPDIFCLSRFSPIACKFMNYQRQDPYFGHDWLYDEPSWEATDDSNESSENSISPLHNSVQRDYIVRPLNNVRVRQVPESSPQPDTYSKLNNPFSSSATANLASYLVGQKILTTSSKNIPAMETTNGLIENKLKHSIKDDTLKSSLEDGEFENSSHFLTDAFTEIKVEETLITDKEEDNINRLTSPKIYLITTHSSTLGTDGKSGYTVSPIETSSSQERLNKPNEEKLQTRSTIFRESSSVITTDANPLESKSSSSDEIEPTNNEDSKISPNEENFEKKSSSADDIQSTSIRVSDLESTSQNPVFSTTDDDISSKIKSSSSEDIHSKNTQTFETESIISQSLSTMTSDDTAFHSKLSSSFETESTTTKILETDSTVEHFTSSKIAPISFTDKFNEGSTQGTFSTESSSLDIHSTSGGITQDHIIEIPSIRTARIVITSTFLVIALIALTVLAVYIFRLRRREVQYDQLMLIS